MTPATLALILVSITMSAVAQILLKVGMASAGVQQAMASSGTNTFYAVASNPAVIGGFALYGAGAAVWLFVLAKTDVTQAYPFVGLSFLITLAMGYFFLAEPVSALRLVGVLFVIGGIAMVAQS